MLDFFKNNTTLSLGQLGERSAAIYLKNLGYKIVCVNFTNKHGRRLGEIDIIAKDSKQIVFVEVKTRKKTHYNNHNLPEENIGYQKLFKLKKISEYYIKTNNLWDVSYRFDAISLIYDQQTEIFTIKHLKSIFL